MVRVLTLVRCDHAVASIEAACRLARLRGFQVTPTHLADRDALAEAIEELASQVVIFDPYPRWSKPILWSTDLVGRSVAPAVIAYSDFAGRPVGQDVLRLVRAGVNHIVTLGIDDAPSDLCQLILNLAEEGSLTEALDPVLQALTFEQRLVITRALRRNGASVASIAKDLGVSPRTLRRWCRDLRSITAHDLVRWGKVLRASRLLTETDLGVDDVAFLVGYAGDSSLRRAFAAVTGCRLSDVERAGLMDLVLDGLLGHVVNNGLTGR